jgi:hypothetical protein
VSGRRINLNPDGTFSLRFALPDAAISLPVKAVSADGTDVKNIEISVTRTTVK